MLPCSLVFMRRFTCTARSRPDCSHVDRSCSSNTQHSRDTQVNRAVTHGQARQVHQAGLFSCGCHQHACGRAPRSQLGKHMAAAAEGCTMLLPACLLPGCSLTLVVGLNLTLMGWKAKPYPPSLSFDSISSTASPDQPKLPNTPHGSSRAPPEPRMEPRASCTPQAPTTHKQAAVHVVGGKKGWTVCLSKKVRELGSAVRDDTGVGRLLHVGWGAEHMH